MLNAVHEKVINAPEEEWEARYNALSQVERDLYDVNFFHFEYIGGGLGAYFTNYASAHWEETLRALERIGALEAYEMLNKACALFPGGKPSANLEEFEDQANDPGLQGLLRALGGFDDVQLMERLELYWRAQGEPRTE